MKLEKFMIVFVSVAALTLASTQASAKNQDLLIKLAPTASINTQMMVESLNESGSKAEVLTESWLRVQASGKKAAEIIALAKDNADIEYVQPNYKIKLLEDYQIQDPLRRAAFLKFMQTQGRALAPADNPSIPPAPAAKTGADPLLRNQWGMLDNKVTDAWKFTIGSPDMTVAVIDTGVDYTHEDLLPNLWRNSKEIAGNNIDDDNNGYVDDVIGWDFSSNDNLPYDLSFDSTQVMFEGKNPGHGTHCAGNVAARGDNGVGIAGVAPNVKIMSLRFISGDGSGTTAGAVKSIRYAVDNGAKVLSNSWGAEGEDPSEPAENKALRDAIVYAQEKGVLFVAAAGNGRQGIGFNNDNDKAPAIPASYDFENIISVAALDSNNQLGRFSNWGFKTVDIGAPGVNVYSTMVGNRYSNYVTNSSIFNVTWDGTSMATPHVAGAAALYWSLHPTKTWSEVKTAILTSAKKIPSLSRKVSSEGKLDVLSLMQR